MPAPRSIGPRSPLPGRRPTIYLVGGEDDPANASPAHLRPASLAGPAEEETVNHVTDIIPADTPMSNSAGQLPTLIRLLSKLIAVIRWFPLAWSLLCSIPSEARQAWRKAFGPKE